jgi:cardiolipin synthase
MNAAAQRSAPSGSAAPLRVLAEQAFSRAAGAPLIGGNAVELLIDARANFDAWLAAIRSARHAVLFENYIFRDDAVGRAFRAALVERANAGVRVCVLRDWLGCLGQSRLSFWQPLLDAGGEVRTWNPPHLSSPLDWISRDHRKLLIVDARVGFLAGVCVSARWLGDPDRGVPPWRDTGLAVRGPALRDLHAAFADAWARIGPPLPTAEPAGDAAIEPCGDVDLRVVATVPNTAGLFRLDQFIAAIARRYLWLADAYFVGISAYVQALVAAARDGVDVRLLVPGSNDIPVVGALSRAGYRPLLEAGVRVFEWNGSMMHAKTAVADGRWARVGSTNLNLASWIGNCELDVAIEDEAFAECMREQYERDLGNATEILLAHRRRRHRRSGDEPAARRAQGGSSGRAAAGAMRIANTLGAAIANRRVLGPAEAGALLGGGLVLLAIAFVGALWPRVLAWPLALFVAWIGVALLLRHRSIRRKTGHRNDASS